MVGFHIEFISEFILNLHNGTESTTAVKQKKRWPNIKNSLKKNPFNMNIYISAAPPIYMSYTPTDDLLEKSVDGGLSFPAQAFPKWTHMAIYEEICSMK